MPGDWVVDASANRTEGQTGHMKSPNGKVAVSIQEHAPGQTLARAKEVALAFNKDAKTMEDSPKRVWLAYNRAGMTIWDVLTAGNPVCDAQVIMDGASMQDIAKKIVATVGPAK